MKTNKSLFLFLVIIIALVLSTNAAYSLFSKTIAIQTSFIFGDADIELQTLFDTQNFTYEEAGDNKEASLTVENQGQNALEYYFGIEIEESGGLEDMIMVYFDNDFVGILSRLCQNGEYIFDKYDYLYLNEQRQHSLTFELHMGAESYHDNKTLKVKINAYGKTLSNQEVVFVGDEYELTQAIETLGEGVDIKLNQDITVSSIIQIDKDLTIDLYGKNLILEGGDLVVIDGTTTFKNSRDIPQNIITGTGNIIINGTDAEFYMEEGTGQYINLVDLISFDLLSTEQEIIQRIASRIGKGLFNGSYDIFKNDIIYIDLFNQINDEYADFNNGVLTVYPTTLSKMSKLSFSTLGDLYEIEYKIYAMGTEATAESIAQNQLAYLYNLEDYVANDIFLPTRLKAFNSHIEWFSSKPNIISEEGRYTPAIEDTEVTLIAFINVEGDIYPYTFYLDVLGQSNEARFRYFLTRYGDLLFTSLGQINNLPVADSQSQYYYFEYTDGRDLKISDLTYDLDMQYDFLTLYGNQLELSSITYVQYAQLNVTAEFEDGGFESGIIGVRIELGDTVFINDVFAYVQSQFELRGDVLNNFYDTGSGDFDMPKEHLSLDISYEIEDAFYTPGEEPVSVSGQDNEQIEEASFHIFPQYLDVFEQYVIVTVEVLTMTRQMEFLLPAAIHNDENGFESLNVFERVKAELGITDPLQDYIFIDFIRNSSLQHLDLSGLNLDDSVEGLAYFSNITSLDVSGTSSTMSCSTPDYANVLSRAISRLSQLEILDMSYTNLENMHNVRFLTNLQELNLKGNNLIYIFNDILNFENLSYLNLCQTGYHTTYSQPVLELAYFTYYNKWGSTPEYYYTDLDPNVEILFVPENSHQDYVAGLGYLYNLSEIPEIKVQYTHLVTQVIINSNYDSINLSWAVVEDSSQTLAITTVTSNDYTTTRIVRSSVPAQDSMAVVSAQLTVGSQTVTRYFYVKIRGAS